MDVIDEKGLLNENPNVIVQDSFPRMTSTLLCPKPQCYVRFISFNALKVNNSTQIHLIC